MRSVFVKIIIVLLSILVIVWILQTLFGGSPSVEELLIGIVLLMGSLVLHHNKEIGIMKNDCKHNFLNIKNSFNSIKEDMSLIKKDMNLIKKRLKI